MCLFAAAMAIGPQAAAQSSQFKGWATVWKEVSARIAPVGMPLDVDQFLPAEDMEDLLGTWSTFGSEHTFRNGAPNALNMMIWQVALSGFADAVAASCAKPRLAFNEMFQATLRSACTWPSTEARSDGVLQAFWIGIAGYDAPESEYRAWRDFLRRTYAERPAVEAVRAMTFAATMQPSFLLHR
jgi:hypothetical protein